MSPPDGPVPTPGWSVEPLDPATLETTCLLCGQHDRDVAFMLIEWHEGDPFGSGPRCRDHDACWQRVTDRGEEWLCSDGRPLQAPARQESGSGQAPAEEQLDFGSAPEDAA